MSVLQEKVAALLIDYIHQEDAADLMAERILALPEIAEAQRRIAELEADLDATNGDAKF